MSDPNYTRITIVSTGWIYKGPGGPSTLEKLIDVRAVTLLEPENTVFAQHMYIKMHLTGSHRGSSKHQVLDLIQRVRRKSRRLQVKTSNAEITGDNKKVESFIEKSQEILVY